MTPEDFGHVPCPEWRDRLAPESRPCACGSDIRRQPFESIAAVVRRHNASGPHRRWWERVRTAWQ